MGVKADVKPDFGGYATKAGLKCSDGRTITPEAFKHMDGLQVPLVWQHGHNDPENVLGHAVLEARADGVYCNAWFNDTKKGVAAKELVKHGDIKHLSIYANQLVEKTKKVLHGMICEVSLTIKGANPGALIDQVNIQHSDDPYDVTELEDAAIIHTGLEFDLVNLDDDDEDDEDDSEFGHADGDPTIQDIVDTFDEAQMAVVNYLVGVASEAASNKSMEQSAVDDKGTEGNEGTEDKAAEGDLKHQEGTIVTKNLFEASAVKDGDKKTLSHSDVRGIFDTWQNSGGTLKGALKEYALAHGIDDIELLFPDAKAVQDRPELDKRRTEWVSVVLNGTHKTPFSKIKTLSADLTLDAARAKGYVKGNLKKEEWFGLSKRTTGSTTVYKKQKLDRDDIIDVTDFDIVAWLWQEIRLMLEEEVARAILIGDGREVDDEDKIKDPAAASDGDGIRSILHDHDYYAMTVNVNLGSTPNYTKLVDQVIKTRRFYKGTGGLPTMFTTEVVIAEFLTLRDAVGRRVYRTLDELASELRVAQIVPVEPMEQEDNLLCIIVNLNDYNVGTNKGGEIAQFDDFDIDYNQYKYLMETRLSGALTKLKSALIYMAVADPTDTLVTPNAPTFVSNTGVVTIVATTGVVYKNKATGATLSTGAQSAIAAGEKITVVATAAADYYLDNTVEDEWTFQRDHA